MQRELSSRVSFFHRRVVPIIFSGSSVLVLWLLASEKFAPAGGLNISIWGITIVLPMLALSWHLSRAKRVWVEGGNLIAKGLAEEFLIPFKDIDEVTATRFWNPEQVTIRFRSATGENQSLFFFPKFRWFPFWSLHPVAEEIRNLIHSEISPNTAYEPRPQPTAWRRVFIGVIGVAAFAAVLLSAITNSMRSSEPYKWSLVQAQSNPAILVRLGSPIEPNWFISGSMTTSGDRASAYLRYSVTGPKGGGKVLVSGKLKDGIWIYERAGVLIDEDYVSFTEY